MLHQASPGPVLAQVESVIVFLRAHVSRGLILSCEGWKIVSASMQKHFADFS